MKLFDEKAFFSNAEEFDVQANDGLHFEQACYSKNVKANFLKQKSGIHVASF